MTAHHLVLDLRTTRPAALPGFLTDLRSQDHGVGALRRAAREAELGGLSGVVLPFSDAGLEPLIVAGALLRATRSLQVTASIDPALINPVYAAKLSASLQRFSRSRLAWLLQIELPGEVARAHGDTVDDLRDRYRRASEFITLARRVWHQSDVELSGRFYTVQGGGLPDSPRSRRAFPRIYVAGGSDAAHEFAARHADAHVLGLGEEPVAGLGAGVERVLTVVSADVTSFPKADELFIQGVEPDALRLGELVSVG